MLTFPTYTRAICERSKGICPTATQEDKWQASTEQWAVRSDSLWFRGNIQAALACSEVTTHSYVSLEKHPSSKADSRSLTEHTNRHLWNTNDHDSWPVYKVRFNIILITGSGILSTKKRDLFPPSGAGGRRLLPEDRNRSSI
jgi:hypothetical protein